jgi:hypothetical protein
MWIHRVLAIAGAACVVSGCDAVTGGLNSQQGYEPAQPIPYSHALHAGEYQIPCQYCHFGAERSRHAGVPPLNVCMNCHSQVKKDAPDIEKIATAVKTGKPIEWVRVHRLPDFAYFPHHAHIRAKIVCQTCHGPIQTMVRVRQVETMSMGWCLDCHRKTEAEGQGLHPPTDCSACHH